MYAVQNDTEIKCNIVLYMKVIFVGQGVGIQKAYPQAIQISNIIANMPHKRFELSCKIAKKQHNCT